MTNKLDSNSLNLPLASYAPSSSSSPSHLLGERINELQTRIVPKSVQFFYHKMLDDEKLSRDKIEFLNFEDSLDVLVQELVKFKAAKALEIPLIDKLISDLRFAQNIAHSLNQKDPDFNALEQQIIATLKFSNEVIIPLNSEDGLSLFLLQEHDGIFTLVDFQTTRFIYFTELVYLKELISDITTPKNTYEIVMKLIQSRIPSTTFNAFLLNIKINAVATMDASKDKALAFDEASHSLARTWSLIRKEPTDSRLSRHLNAYRVKNPFYPTVDLRLFYMKVLDSKSERSNLSGMATTYEILQSLTLDLIHFYNILEMNDPKIQNLIDDLIFAQYIDCYLFYNTEKSISDLSQEITRKVKDLIPGRSVIMPVCSKDHAELYQITLEHDGTLSLTIFDSSMVRAIDDQNINLSFIKLSTEDFNHQFFEQLLSLCHHAENSPIIFDFLSSKLTKTIGPVEYSLTIEKLNKPSSRLNDSQNLVLGPPGKRQKHDSCALKCAHALLHTNLKEADYRSFKAWMTANEISKLPDIRTELGNYFFQKMVDNPESQIILNEYIKLLSQIDDMEREAKEVLIKRQAKCH